MARTQGRRIQEVSIRPGPIDLRRLYGGAQMVVPGRSIRKSDRPTRSKMIDAFDWFGAYRGVKDKHTRITFDVLRRMAKTCEPMAAIVQLRCNQAAAFAKEPEYESDAGFRITTRDPKAKVRKAEEKEIRRLTDYLLKTGTRPDPERPNFDAFMRMIVRDSLILDGYAFEMVPGKQPRKNPIVELWPVDGASIRFAQEELYQAQLYTEDAGEISFVQEIDGNVTAEYTHDELAYGIRNPSTELRSNGYGTSELEIAVNLITSILYGMQYNRNYFNNNSTPRGIISMVGNYSPEDLEAFKRAWRAQLEGVANSWRTPMMAMEEGQGINFIPLDQKGNRDMEFHLWLDFLVNFLCALYLVNPSELGIKGYNPQGPSLSEGSKKDEVEQGEDKGLVPLLTNVGNSLNDNVLHKLNEDFKLQWTGLRQDDKQQKATYYGGLMAAGVMTANEVRTQGFDLKEIDEKWAEAPANATLYQAWAIDNAPQPNPATAGGPMQPPGALGAGQPGQPGAGPPKPGQPGQPGQGPPKPPGNGSQMGHMGPPKPPQAPNPMQKSLVAYEDDVLVITIE